jgi:hypothetical protein
MPNKFDKLAEEAQAITDAQFRERFSNLTSLSETDIGKIVKSSGISKENLAQVLLEIRNTTNYNNKTTQNIINIQHGVGALMAIAKKLLL